MTAAHEEHQTIRLIRAYPDHEPRVGDPHYNLFEQAKARIKKQNLWKCSINNDECAGQIQLHHDYIEFAYLNDVDVDKINELLGLHLDDESFQTWIESPANLEPLCQTHHTGLLGIHMIPTADWTILRVHKAGTHPIQKETSEQNH